MLTNSPDWKGSDQPSSKRPSEGTDKREPLVWSAGAGPVRPQEEDAKEWMIRAIPFLDSATTAFMRLVFTQLSVFPPGKRQKRCDDDTEA